MVADHWRGLMMGMDLNTHFQMMARYNRMANERLYECCSRLDEAEYRQVRQGSFGSIHALLNHILLGDRIWMARFEGGGSTTPPLRTILFDEFAPLRTARSEEDRRIEAFFGHLPVDFLFRKLRYVNSRGESYEDEAAASVAHMFNHQTHHRGQVHILLSQTAVVPPSLDLHRIVNP